MEDVCVEVEAREMAVVVMVMMLFEILLSMVAKRYSILKKLHHTNFFFLASISVVVLYH